MAPEPVTTPITQLETLNIPANDVSDEQNTPEVSLTISNSSPVSNPIDDDEQGEKRKRIDSINPLWKTSICSYFRKTGESCSHGETCRYAHGENELRIRPDITLDPSSDRAKKLKLENEEDVMTDSVLEEGCTESALDKCFQILPLRWTSDNLENFLNEQGKNEEFFNTEDEVKTAIEKLQGKPIGNKNLEIRDFNPRSFERNVKSVMNLDKSGNGENGVGNDRFTPGSGRSARDAVTPLARTSYADQLEQKTTSIKQKQQPPPLCFEVVQLPSSTTQKHKKTCKKVVWSDDEYKLLAEMWIHISEDGGVGNGQPGNAFWNRIQNDYNILAQQSNFPQRNKDQITSKWRNMNTSVKLFNGFYNQCTRIQSSGTSDEQVLASALSMYSAETKTSFKYIKAWYVLKDHPKWKNLKDVTSSSKRPIDVDIDDDTQKDRFGDDTIQRSPEKGKNKSQKPPSTFGTVQEQAASFCGSLLDQLKKITKIKKEALKAQKHALEAQKQASEAQKQASEAQKQASDAQTRKYDFAFLAMSTENITETDAVFIEKEKNRIRLKYGIM